uniref:universal stress protein Slr1101-like n=1 Tax=Styela clava TaxID=7725 RepID=UPI00193A4803|nr:universal stress protein Slr1101-like [Styela clava]
MAETQQEQVEEVFSVLICVDKSENSEHAFDYYIQHLNKPNHNVVIAYVAEMTFPVEYLFAGAGGRFPMPVGIGPSPAVAQELIENEQKKKKSIESKYKKKCEKLGINFEFKILVEVQGGIGASLVEEAKTRGTNLIIIGSRGQGLVRRTILGSVSDYVLHHSHAPTLICPKQE